jgi:hypothetical protein
VGGGGQHGGYDALDYRKIKHANAGPLGTYPILSVLPDKFARFLFEFHSGRFESLDLPIYYQTTGASLMCTAHLRTDALIQATASPFLLLDVQVFHRQLFGNMIF